MKLKYEYVIEEVAGQKIAVAVGTNIKKGGFLKLNNTGAYIMQMLKNDVSVEEIVASIQKDFEVEDPNQVITSVNLFVECLKKAEILK